MNREIERAFFTINSAFSHFQGVVREAYKEYIDAKIHAKEDSKKFDSQRFFEEKRKDAAQKCREEYRVLHDQLAEIVEKELARLDKEASIAVLAAPDARFLPNLRTIRDFGLKPTRAEAEALLQMTYGSGIAIKALNATIKPAGMEVSGAIDYEADLAEIRAQLLDSEIYIPLDLPEALDIWIGEKMPSKKENGELYFTGAKYDVQSAAITAQRFASRMERINDMGERWSNATAPRIAQIQEYEDAEDGPSAAEQFVTDLMGTSKAYHVTNVDDLSLAAERAARDAVDAEAYMAVMAHYGNGGK